jgi:acetyl esterase/lipase
MSGRLAPVAVLLASCAAPRQYLRPGDFEHAPIPYNARFAYGPDTLQHADLRLPTGPGPYPVAVIVHGGCWRAWHSSRHMEEVAQWLTQAGWATWNLEYRTVDRPGGGWPGTLLDVGAGTDYLREVAKRVPLDLTRVVAIGHSAGGHLALWLAARHRVPVGTTLYSRDPLPMAGVVSLAGIPDLRRYHELMHDACGEGVGLLIGGLPESAPARYAQASPAELLPLGVPQLLLHGVDDRNVPLHHAQAYADVAKARGDAATLVVIPRAAHFELMAPGAEAWARIQVPLLAFLGTIGALGR